MRHQARFVNDHIKQGRVNFDRINRGQPQAGQARHAVQNGAHQMPQARLRFIANTNIGAIRGNIDAGQHNFLMAVLHQRLTARHHIGDRHGTRIAAAIRDNAKCAAMVAAGLHLHKGARAPALRRRRQGGGLCLVHNIADRRAVLAIAGRVQFFFIAQNAVNFRHGGKGFGIGLGGAAGDNHRLPVAFGFARCLTGLAQRFAGNRTAINNRGVFQPRRMGQSLDTIAFQRVKTAAEIFNAQAHRVTAASKSWATGPVMRRWVSG